MKSKVSKGLLAGLAALAIGFMSVPQAMADHRHHRGWGGPPYGNAWGYRRHHRHHGWNNNWNNNYRRNYWGNRYNPYNNYNPYYNNRWGTRFYPY
ncbi:MAG: hypothetical protein K2Z81_08170 [Cyanobacteria bacterium]|nr:hypothetical protein [Cyanobacteriota bacterium]